MLIFDLILVVASIFGMAGYKLEHPTGDYKANLLQVLEFVSRLV